MVSLNIVIAIYPYNLFPLEQSSSWLGYILNTSLSNSTNDTNGTSLLNKVIKLKSRRSIASFSDFDSSNNHFGVRSSKKKKEKSLVLWYHKHKR